MSNRAGEVKYGTSGKPLPGYDIKLVDENGEQVKKGELGELLIRGPTSAMGENILILAFVVIIIGGIGSIRGAFVAAILVGLLDTIGRAFLPDVMRTFLSYSAGSSAGPALSSMMIYLLMALVLVFRPEGLFPAASK